MTATATVAEGKAGYQNTTKPSSSENISSLPNGNFVVLALPVPTTVNNVRRTTLPKPQNQPQFPVSFAQDVNDFEFKDTCNPHLQPNPTPPMHPEHSQKINWHKKLKREKSNKQQEKEEAKTVEQFEEKVGDNPIAPCSFDTYGQKDNNTEKKKRKRSNIITVDHDLQQRVQEEEIEGQPEHSTIVNQGFDKKLKKGKRNKQQKNEGAKIVEQFEENVGANPLAPCCFDTYSQNDNDKEKERIMCSNIITVDHNLQHKVKEEIEGQPEGDINAKPPVKSEEVSRPKKPNLDDLFSEFEYKGSSSLSRRHDKGEKNVSTCLGKRVYPKNVMKTSIGCEIERDTENVVSPYFMKSEGNKIEENEEKPLEMVKTIKRNYAKKADNMKSEKEDVIQIESERVSSKRKRKDAKHQKKADEVTEVSLETSLKIRKRKKSVINTKETKRANLATKEGGQNLKSEKEQEIEIETGQFSSKGSKKIGKGQKKAQTNVRVVSRFFVKSDGEQKDKGEKKPLKSIKSTKVSPCIKNEILGKENAVGDSGESIVKQKRKAIVLTREEKMSEAYRKRSPDNKWKPPRSVHNLLQEDHAYDPWRVLVICLLLNKTSGTQVKRVLPEFFALCPNAKTAIEVETAKITEVTRSLGFYNQRSESIQRFSRQYLEDKWTHVTQLHGVGKYAADGYAIFCNGNWKLVKPHDHKLNDYWKFLHNPDWPPSN